MNYLIIEKRAFKVIFKKNVKVSFSELKPKDVFPDFNSKIMIPAWTSKSVIPPKFEISSEGQVVEIKAEPINSYSYETQKWNIQSKPPFVTKEKDEVVYKGALEILEEDRLKNLKECNVYLDVIDLMIEEQIEKTFPHNLEMKITKGYLAWLNEGKLKDDRREVRFLDMEEKISEIKKSFVRLKDYGKKKLEMFSS